MPNGRELATRIPRDEVRRLLDSISGNPVVGLITGGDPPVGVVQRKPVDLSQVKALADSFPEEELFVEGQHDELIPGGSAIVIHFGRDWVWVTVKDSIFPVFRTFWLDWVRRRTLPKPDSRVTVHMAASLDGFIARKDGSVDWLETSDHFADGAVMDPGFADAFLAAIDCYVMGSRTYETALRFEAQGLGWSYGDKPTFVLSTRNLPCHRASIAFYSGDLTQLVNERLRPVFRSIWFVGGGAVAGECLRLGLADEVYYSILPILIGDGISFFDQLDRDVALHLDGVKAYQNGVVELRYATRRPRTE